MCRHVPINASFFKYGTHCLTWTPSQCLGQSNDKGNSSRTQSFFFFLFYKYTARRRSYTNHYYIQMNLITSQSLRCLVFSLFQTHSVVFIQACVYSNTVCLRADSTFAYSYWCLVCVCTNITQRFFGLQLKGWCMWNFIIIDHTGMCVKLYQHGTRQELQHNTRK